MRPRWTKKNEESFYGYKNHVSVDRKHKIIRRYAETDTSVHAATSLTVSSPRASLSRLEFQLWPCAVRRPMRLRIEAIIESGCIRASERIKSIVALSVTYRWQPVRVFCSKQFLAFQRGAGLGE